MTNLSRLAAAALLAAVLFGCGGPKPATAPKPDTTSALSESAVSGNSAGPESTGAVGETLPDTVAANSVQPPPKPPEPQPVAVEAAEKSLPKLWDFGSNTCVPCRTMKQILDPMKSDYKDKVEIRTINVYEDKELTTQFRVSVIPTLVFMDAQGKELHRHMGVYPRDSIEACFKEFGFPVVSGTQSPTPSPATGST